MAKIVTYRFKKNWTSNVEIKLSREENMTVRDFYEFHFKRTFFYIFTHMLDFRHVVFCFRLYHIEVFFIFDNFATFAKDVIHSGMKCSSLR